MANNTGIIIGVSVVAVLGIVITIVVVKSKSTPAYPPYNPNQYPLGYNPANFPPGYQQPNNSDKAALYTGIASVANNVLSTFFKPNPSGGMSDSRGNDFNQSTDPFKPGYDAQDSSNQYSSEYY